ncbi:NAD(P)H-dependent flavin oxidoreductase [Ferroacidibacillus organovorans]|uniref:Probable nitronate monooxygenase n=1 Tax=Ferroacidibacillus organovorans TaxID=1765683 RepID=A0A853K830_9BACL|nr:nitronate monooxygenase [Ferroacidibacillus organovorans]KYP81129.1 2-nitropropane dioxygenase [Ferroacidibacillus organovorans]OAG93095.1 2-nitropropane dioxygenase [Ferroacidibacillus organovorans]
MDNRVISLLGCRLPIVQGGLAYVGNGVLAGAISRAGGFGQVGSAGRTPEQMLDEIEKAAKEAAGAPFGVNLPLSEHSDREAYVEVILSNAQRLRAVSLSAGNPRPYIDRLKRAGLTVIALVSTPLQAQKAEAAGADLLVAEGYEAGGHNGPGEWTTMALIPAVARAVQVPILAAGGIATGDGIVAAFALGASGVQMGTRFVATKECEAHENYKAELMRRSADDTRIIERSRGRVTRVLQSEHVDDILELEKRNPSESEVYALVRGEKNRVAAIGGTLEEGYVNCGQGVSLIHDAPSVDELFQRLTGEMREATRRIRSLDTLLH